jgi:choline dehydrogenase-like flavoprotein
MGNFALGNSELDWSYTTTPQEHTNNRIHTESAGKAPGGGSIISYGGWTHGDASDYDDRWSCKEMLPFFRKSEHYFDPKADLQKHGFDGRIHVTSVSASGPKRLYGLRQPVRTAFTELGVPKNENSSGSTAGISEYAENWHNWLRQGSSLAYGLQGVRIMTDTKVHQVLVSGSDDGKHVASGAQLADDRKISAGKEIIVCAGVFRTPQILMLSGIGPANELSKHNIPVVVDSPHVGKNLFEHFAHFQLWKLRNPEKGLAMGTSLWTDPAYLKGLPSDQVVNEGVSHLFSLEEDNEKNQQHLPHHSRSLFEITIIYAGIGLPVPMDGSIIASSTMLLLPTFRGGITLSSKSPADPPIINPNCYATHVDRVAQIQGTRRAMKALLETAAGKTLMDSKLAAPGEPALNSDSTNAEIDARIRNTGVAHKNAAGSAPMGKVVGLI